MTEERRRILNMMAEGKINAAEAEALFDALAENSASQLVPAPTQSQVVTPKYLRVLVEGDEDGRPNKVNVRVPIELIRAGMRLAALIPVVAYEPVNRALKENGVDVDLSKLKPEDIEGLVAHLQELQVDVDDGTERVRVFCE
jgi:Asp-tRNA(Asn)/Glu-tRNA(Gln) amidotransferase B subunit